MKKIKDGALFLGVCGGIGKSLGIGADIGELIGLFLFFGTSWFWWVYFLLALLMNYEDE